LLVERRDGVAVLTVSDPERRNALTLGLSDDLAAAVAACERDESVGALVVTGAPPAFCAGGDLGTLATAGKSGGDHDLRRIYEGFLAVARCPLPTVAAVNGPAVGAGLNLALACDVRLAGPAARFDARFLTLGIHPGGGVTWLLQRAVGPQAAAAMMLFNEVCPPGPGAGHQAHHAGHRGNDAARCRRRTGDRPAARLAGFPGRCRDHRGHRARRPGTGR
jgi:enoyl-CoA hydratase